MVHTACPRFFTLFSDIKSRSCCGKGLGIGRDTKLNLSESKKKKNKDNCHIFPISVGKSLYNSSMIERDISKVNLKIFLITISGHLTTLFTLKRAWKTLN